MKNKSELAGKVATITGTRVNQLFSLICAETEKRTGVSEVVENIDWPKGTNEIEKRNFIGSSERLQSLTGWSPSISLEEGIKLLVNHYDKEYINDSVS